MEKYQIVKKLGSGTFGNVEMAEDKKTGEIVAIKRLKKKYGTWEECLQLSEVKALRRMNHPNIVRLKEVIRVVNEAYFVFEYIEKDLYKLMTERREQGTSLKEPEIRYITRQLVEAIVYIHKQGFFHRDMKPENILVSPDLTIKIIDFGIAREIRSKPPYTEYISTRWYRAPELLFKFPTYSAAVDVFALGCIVAEMYLGRPLFQGSSEMDQISKIASILGSPGSAWPEGVKQAVKRGIGIP
jgi:serine/threonine protein kinase